MARSQGEWTPAWRAAFWVYVGIRMRERGLSRAALADALGLDRSALSRRLSGQIHARPSLTTVIRVAAALALTTTEATRLAALAGYRSTLEPDDEPMPPAERGAPEADTSAAPVGAMRLLRRVVFATLVGICAIVTGALLPKHDVGRRRPVSPRPISGTARRESGPGGIWISPGAGAHVGGAIQFAARAYSTQAFDPPVASVQFTLSWDGRPGPWLVACRVTAPTLADEFACSFDPREAGLPSGPIHISFDVYDQANPSRRRLAPNGVHTIVYAP